MLYLTGSTWRRVKQGDSHTVPYLLTCRQNTWSRLSQLYRLIKRPHRVKVSSLSPKKTTSGQLSHTSWLSQQLLSKTARIWPAVSYLQAQSAAFLLNSPHLASCLISPGSVSSFCPKLPPSVQLSNISGLSQQFIVLKAPHLVSCLTFQLTQHCQQFTVLQTHIWSAVFNFQSTQQFIVLKPTSGQLSHTSWHSQQFIILKPTSG